MQPVIWREDAVSGLKRIQLRLETDEDGDITINAVDEGGDTITPLLWLFDGKFKVAIFAKEHLVEHGYDVSALVWDELDSVEISR